MSNIEYNGKDRVRQLLDLIEEKFGVNLQQQEFPIDIIKNKFSMTGDTRIRTQITKRDIKTLVDNARTSISKREQDRIEKVMKELLKLELETFKKTIERI